MKQTSVQTLSLAAAVLALAGSSASAQFSVVHAFAGTGDGAKPNYGGPVVSGGTIYGAASYASGTTGGGVVFSVGTDGSSYTALHTFASAAGDGFKPLGGITLSGSTIYGTTYRGGSGAGDAGYGAVYSINTDGSGYQTLHSFSSAEANRPYGTVTVSGSKLYGMTYYSGVSSSAKGAVYSLDIAGGGFTTLHTFVGGASDGATPLGGKLTVIGSTVYGLTAHGGPGASSTTDGVAFSLGTDGSGYNNLHNFIGGAADGGVPYGSLTLVGSKFYGLTRYGGSAGQGVVFSMNQDGSDFTKLYDFLGGATSGAQPNGSLTFENGVLYGTTRNGGSTDAGTVFGINLDGSGFNLLHSFTSATDGANPLGDLAYENGTLYGWTSAGGAGANGTLFALAVPEPSVLALSLGGLSVVLFRRRQS